MGQPRGRSAEPLTLGGAGPFSISVLGQCLTYDNPGRVGSPLYITPCDRSMAQQFQLVNGTIQPVGVSPAGSLCVDDPGFSTANQTVMQIIFCNGGSNQNFAPQADGTIRVLGKCLDLPGFVTAPANQLEIFDCNGGANQSFLIFPTLPTRVATAIPNSNSCIDLTSSNTTNGTNVGLFTCKGGSTPDNQTLSFQADGSVQVLGKCLDVPGSRTGNGTPLQIFDCNGGSNQHFTLEPDGSLHVLGKCIDVPGFNPLSGMPLQIFDCNGGTNQQWVGANQATHGAWSTVGPAGMSVKFSRASNPVTYSGLILAIDANAGRTSPRIGTGFGGAFQLVPGALLPVMRPMSDALTTTSISAVATYPKKPNVVLLGTGFRSDLVPGTGIWRTADGGSTFTNVLSGSAAGTQVSQILYASNPQIVHVATDGGYYRSLSGGTEFSPLGDGHGASPLLSGTVTGLALDPTNSNNLYAAVYGSGFYKSINGGTNWVQLSVNVSGFSNASAGVTSIAIAKGSPSTVFFQTENTHGSLLGIYRTTDAGNTFQDVTPQGIDRDQADYDNVIAVSPNNPLIVLSGLVKMQRGVASATNGSITWTLLDTGDLHDNLHDDHHAIVWSPDGKTVYDGNDGGLSFSTDDGATWTEGALLNSIPDTMYHRVDAVFSATGAATFIGAAQDNGTSVSTDGQGLSWANTQCCDVTDVTINPLNPSQMWSIDSGSRNVSNDSGNTWTQIANGIPFDANTKIRTDGANPLTIYTQGANQVYSSSDSGTTWTSIHSFTANVHSIAVAPKPAGGPVVYAAINTGNPNDRLWVLDNGTWNERSDVADWPAAATLRDVVADPNSSDVAFALLDTGSTTASKQVYETRSRGQSWMNVTGNLSSVLSFGVPLDDVVPDPWDLGTLYLATDFGLFKSTNGGGAWAPWNAGWNAGLQVKSLHLNVQGGTTRIFAGTWGRSVWRRDGSGTDL